MQTFQALKKYDFVTKNLNIFTFYYVGPIKNGLNLFNADVDYTDLYQLEFDVLDSSHKVLYNLRDPIFIQKIIGIFNHCDGLAEKLVKDKAWKPELCISIDDFWNVALSKITFNKRVTPSGINKLKDMAYERGYSKGFRGVWNELVDLVDLINECN